MGRHAGRRTRTRRLVIGTSVAAFAALAAACAPVAPAARPAPPTAPPTTSTTTSPPAPRPAAVLDGSFASGGAVELGAPGDTGPGSATGMTALPDGSVVVHLGLPGQGPRNERISGAGVVDPDFQAQPDTTAFPVTQVSALATTSDGRVVVAGAADLPESCQKNVVVVWRLLPSGAPDPGFGGPSHDYTGAVDPDICAVTTVSLDGQGRPLVLYATVPQPDTPVCALERFGADGTTIDVPYHLHANAVFTAAPFAGDACLTAVALADGREIVVGRHRVFRLAADGTLDTTYGTAGSTVLDGYDPTGTLSAARTADGGLIIGGDTFDGHGYRFMLTRLTPDGAVDPTFGVGGRAVAGFADLAPEPAGLENTDHLSTVRVRADGTIVAVGTTPVGVALVRLTAAGTPDPAFASGGRVVIGAPEVKWTTASSAVEQVALFPSGDLVVAFGTVAQQPVELVRLDLT